MNSRIAPSPLQAERHSDARRAVVGWWMWILGGDGTRGDLLPDTSVNQSIEGSTRTIWRDWWTGTGLEHGVEAVRELSIVIANEKTNPVRAVGARPCDLPSCC